jgi:hypothetical protein
MFLFFENILKVDLKNGFAAVEQLVARDARWFFKPKIPIWVNLGGPWNGKCWYIL